MKSVNQATPARVFLYKTLPPLVNMCTRVHIKVLLHANIPVWYTDDDVTAYSYILAGKLTHLIPAHISLPLDSNTITIASRVDAHTTFILYTL